MAENINIAGRLHSAATGNVVAGADEILYEPTGGTPKKQSEVNQETSAALTDRYTKSETYSKTQLNSMITTPDVKYRVAEATPETTSPSDVLPEQGSSDTIYRISFWDGSQYKIDVYTEYTWTGEEYIKLSVKNYGFDEGPTLNSGNLLTSDSIAKSLGYNIDSEEFVEVHLDAEDKILYGIKKDGDFIFGKLPTQIKSAIDTPLYSKVDKIEGKQLSTEDYTTEEKEKLSSLPSEAALVESFESKVDKVNGKSLIDSDYAESQSVVENGEYLQVTVDTEGKILEGITTEGKRRVMVDVEYPNGIPNGIKEFVNVGEPLEIYYAACGDSITNANHGNIYDIEDDDPYVPIDGYSGTSTYKRKNYAYYLSQRYKLKWANYGWGGTCLHDCRPKAFYDIMELSYPFVGTRIENLKAGINWDYISIFFGWNDCYFGPIYQRDLWLQETYGTQIGYPVEAEQIGAAGFADATQKAACDAATGSVGGVQYNDTNQYFFARFIGTINDNTKTTWMGAWNYALEYLMRKYPTAKIMIVAPYVSEYSAMVRQSVKDIAEKWGVVCFDFEELPYWYYKTMPNYTSFAPASGQWTTEGGIECGNTVEGYNQARFSYDTLHPSNLGYVTLSRPFGDKLLNF